jgi:hypothetical protein
LFIVRDSFLSLIPIGRSGSGHGLPEICLAFAVISDIIHLSAPDIHFFFRTPAHFRSPLPGTGSTTPKTADVRILEIENQKGTKDGNEDRIPSDGGTDGAVPGRR